MSDYEINLVTDDSVGSQEAPEEEAQKVFEVTTDEGILRFSPSFTEEEIALMLAYNEEHSNG